MKTVSWCRCGSSLPEHERTANCTTGRRTVSVPTDATPAQVQEAIAAAMAQEQATDAQMFAHSTVNGGEKS